MSLVFFVEQSSVNLALQVMLLSPEKQRLSPLDMVIPLIK